MKKSLCSVLIILAISVVCLCVYYFSQYTISTESDSKDSVSTIVNYEPNTEQELKTENYEQESVSSADNYNVSTDDTAAETLPEFHIISDFPYIPQMPELPTGCEITALTMLLNYYGYDVDKNTMATEYLPTSSANLYYDYSGVLRGTNLNDYFIGDPTTSNGCVCGTGAIITAANNYLADVNGTMTAKDITGYSFDDLYELIDNDIPIVVWITIGMAERSEPSGWYTEDGEYVDWSHSDHAGVLIGYTENTVTIADPISGEIEYERSAFESVYTSRGSHGVILE